MLSLDWDLKTEKGNYYEKLAMRYSDISICCTLF